MHNDAFPRFIHIFLSCRCKISRFLCKFVRDITNNDIYGIFGKELYGLIGYPLGHSFSQGYFNNKFTGEGINAEYLNFEIPSITDLAEIIATHPALRGLNVTIPYKQDVIPYLDEIDPIARKIGAVNVIRVTRNNAGHVRLKGFNSDIIGFVDSISPLLAGKDHKKLWCSVRAVHRTPSWPDFRNSASRERLCRVHPAGRNHLRRPRRGYHGFPYGHCQYNAAGYVSASGCLPRHPIRVGHRGPRVLRLALQSGRDPIHAAVRRAGRHGQNGLEMLLLQAFASWEMWHRTD